MSCRLSMCLEDDSIVRMVTKSFCEEVTNLLAHRSKINPSCELGGQHGLPVLREEKNSLKEQIQTLYDKVNTQ